MSEKITAEDLKTALKIKYEGQENVLAFEVNSSTGYARCNWIDAIVIGCWPSKGLLRRAFEFKISRQDFMNEMSKPEKNEFFKEHCHEFWYAVAPKVVKSIDEVPEGCGLMVLQKNGLVIKKQAKTIKEPKMDDMFLASLTRSIQKSLKDEGKDVVKEHKESDEYVNLLNTKKAVDAYLSEKGISVHEKPGGYVSFEKVYSPEHIKSCIEKATMDKKMIKDQEHIASMLDKIKDHVVDHIATLIPLTSGLLTDLDEEGKYIFRYLSNNDYSMLNEVLARFEQEKKRGNPVRKRMLKNEAEILKNLLLKESADEDSEGSEKNIEA